MCVGMISYLYNKSEVLFISQIVKMMPTFKVWLVFKAKIRQPDIICMVVWYIQSIKLRKYMYIPLKCPKSATVNFHGKIHKFRESFAATKLHLWYQIPVIYHSNGCHYNILSSKIQKVLILSQKWLI